MHLERLRLIGRLCVQQQLPSGDPCWVARWIGELVGGPLPPWKACVMCPDDTGVASVPACGACVSSYGVDVQEDEQGNLASIDDWRCRWHARELLGEDEGDLWHESDSSAA